MTRKDYVAVARALATTKPEISVMLHGDSYEKVKTARQDIIDRIADVFAADNPRFNRKRFYSACEGETLDS